MKSFSITCLFFLTTIGLFAQGRALPDFDTYHKNITVELLGSSVLTGAAFDMRLQPGRMDGLGFKAGVGGLFLSAEIEDEGGVRDGSVGLVTFPLEINHIVGKRRSGFVSGVGLLPVYGSANYTDEDTKIRADGFTLAGAYLNIGYRHQPLTTGVTFHVNWNPMLVRGAGFIPGWIGLGVGIGFK